jgi:hypothetical protein
MVEIRRQKRGRARTRFEILLSSLKPRHQRILLENPIIERNSKNDRFLLCLFRMEDDRISVSHLKRPYIDKKNNSITTYFDHRRSSKFIDWNCAYCKREIKSEIHNYESKNFTCSKCFDYFVKNSKFVNQRLIDESLRFTEHHKKMIREDQKKFLKYIKRNDES